MEENKNNDNRVGEKSPFAGCAILIVALAVMGFLVGFSIFALFRQFNEIVKFTGDKPAKIETVSVENREGDLNRLAEKLESFRLAVTDDKPAVLQMTAEEMNLAIAAYEPFKDLRGTLRVVSVSPESIVFEISFQMNGKPRMAKEGEGGLMASDPRYLNGTLVATPGLLQREVILQISEINVPGAKVPKEFILQMSPYRIAERYNGTEGIGASMAKLTNVELGDGFVRFEKKEGVVPKDTVTDEQVDVMSIKVFKFFAIAACGFLVFVGIVLFLALRMKKKREIDG